MPSFGLRKLKADSFISSGALGVTPAEDESLHPQNSKTYFRSNIVCGINEYLFVVLCSNYEGYFCIHKNLSVFRTFGGHEISTPLTGKGERIECKTVQVGELRNMLIKGQ